jgi:drug/metabolite transporter (DMT)-like permease
VLITKALTRHDSPNAIVAWQNLTITLFSVPLALWVWRAPSGAEWALLAVCGVLGTAAHWAMARSLQLADISAMQPLRFLDLVWSSLLGIALFGDVPTAHALIGGAVIVASTVWIARHEARSRGSPPG